MGRIKKVQSVNCFLRDARVKAGITQMEAARFLGHSTPQYISNLERELCAPSVEMAIRLCEFYKADRRDLYSLMLEYHQAALKKEFGRLG